MFKYDVTVTLNNNDCNKLENIIIKSDSIESIVIEVKRIRPSATRVLVHGIFGTAIAFSPPIFLDLRNINYH